ncbi:MAG: exodeoxyribonuclease VII large subunit [Pseudomonadales bacterium]|nr:exodeoxyribonuclease VII large subunit [Pseudomonadales bacterium]
MLENSFLSIRVQGELSNFSKPSSGHWYFTLKDARAQIRCAMFKGSNRHVDSLPKEGDEIIVQAKVSLYEGRGDYQLICETMQQAGSGRLQLAFEQLKAKLFKEGLFDSANKQATPKLAKHLGVITSPSGAAIHDVLSVLKRRFPALPVTIYPSPVQGAEAARGLIKAIALAEQQQLCDVLIITRGGGSLEDLWPFNEESLARAIFACSIPIISAVGHEVDFSISDLVADFRAATPSAAAELISPDQDGLRIQIDQLQQRLLNQVRYQIQGHRKACQGLAARMRSPQQRLELQNLQLLALKNRLLKPTNNTLNSYQQAIALLGQRINNQNPKLLIEQKNSHLSHLKQRIAQLIEQANRDRRLALNGAAAMLHSVSPLSTLERGYSIAQNASAEIITDSQQLQIGQQITTKLHSGEFSSTVCAITPPVNKN